jgi:hypothetical protein
VLSSIKSKEESKSDSGSKGGLVSTYRKTVESELDETCGEILKIIEEDLLKNATVNGVTGDVSNTAAAIGDSLSTTGGAGVINNSQYNSANVTATANATATLVSPDRHSTDASIPAAAPILDRRIHELVSRTESTRVAPTGPLRSLR